MARHEFFWSMEAAGLIMGELQIIRQDGTMTTFKRDGSVEVTPSELKIEWCDYCNTWKRRDWGYFEGADGITYLWKCYECDGRK